jgi:predicted ATP-binding protein involved in virulence
MQLISLYIKKYNHLEEFTIEFKQKLSVIIGVNGSGKSSILEVLAQVFSAAYLGEKAEFSFKLTYELSDFTIVELSADAGLTIKMNGNNKIDNALLPSNVVVYYSGLSDKMEKLCKPHEDKQRADFKGGNFTQRPFFYYRSENFKMFLLAFSAEKNTIDRLKQIQY